LSQLSRLFDEQALVEILVLGLYSKYTGPLMSAKQVEEERRTWYEQLSDCPYCKALYTEKRYQCKARYDRYKSLTCVPEPRRTLDWLVTQKEKEEAMARAKAKQSARCGCTIQ
jgi:hypothetical protein